MTRSEITRDPGLGTRDDKTIYSFAGSFIKELAAHFERRIELSLSVTEQHIYLEIGGHSLSTTIERHRL